MASRWPIALVLVASCGPNTSPRPLTPSPAAPVTVAPAPAPETPSPPPAEPAPPPPPRPKHLAVQLPGHYDAMLFDDEAARLDVVARDKLAAQIAAPIELVPEPALAALRALVAAGRVRDGGPRCAQPPTFERAVRLNYPDAWAARAETACMGGSQCTLWLYVREPNELGDWFHVLEWPVRAEASVNVKAVTDVAAFETALRGLELDPPEPEPSDGSGGGFGFGVLGHGFGLGGGGARHRHLLFDIESAGPWTTAPAVKDFARDQKRFDACPAGRGGLYEELVIDVDARGKVDRCAGVESKCLCDVMTAHAFSAGAPLRRARIRFNATGSGGGGFGKLGKRGKRDVFVHMRGYGSEFHDDFDVMREHDKALAKCFAPSASPQRFEFDVTMNVDETGVVTAASVTHGRTALSNAEDACVSTWARSLRFSCEGLAGETAEVIAMVAVLR